MDRRTALATAGAIAIVAITGGAAIGANLGVLDRASADPVGELQPNDPELTTVVVQPAPAPDAPAGGAGSGSDGAWEDEGEGREHADDEGEHEEEHGEYEGRDDDD